MVYRVEEEEGESWCCIAVQVECDVAWLACKEPAILDFNENAISCSGKNHNSQLWGSIKKRRSICTPSSPSSMFDVNCTYCESCISVRRREGEREGNYIQLTTCRCQNVINL